MLFAVTLYTKFQQINSYVILIGRRKYNILSCWSRICPAFANSVDPNQLVSEETDWSGSTLFVIKYVNLYQVIWLADKFKWVWQTWVFC